MDGITTTLGWSIKTISHMALVELSEQIIHGSKMDNSKMAYNMDIFDILVKVVAVINGYIKMVRI